MLPRDHFSNYLNQYDEKTLFCKLFYLSSYSKHDKRISLTGAQVLSLHYAALLQFSLEEDLVNNGCSLFAEEVISKPQYAEELNKSF